MLTVVVGDVVGDVDFSICVFQPEATSGGAWVSIPFCLGLQSDISAD